MRVGPRVVRDPAFLVTRSMEDFVTWEEHASQKRHIARYSNKLDDFGAITSSSRGRTVTQPPRRSWWLGVTGS